MWSNGVGQNRETDEEHDQDCVEEGFHLARVKVDKDGLGMQNCCINIWDGSELELAWFKKNSSYFENNFSTFLLSAISNASAFIERDVLHWVNFLVT